MQRKRRGGEKRRREGMTRGKIRERGLERKVKEEKGGERGL